MLAAAAVLCCVLVVAGLASRSSRDTVWWIAEWIVLAQLAGIALWWGLAWRTRA